MEVWKTLPLMVCGSGNMSMDLTAGQCCTRPRSEKYITHNMFRVWHIFALINVSCCWSPQSVLVRFMPQVMQIYGAFLMQHQSRRSDSSQQGCGKLHCLPFGIEGKDSELSKNPLYVNIMLCGLRCCFDFLHNYVTFCAIIWGYKLSWRNCVLFVNFCTDPLNVS